MFLRALFIALCLAGCQAAQNSPDEAFWPQRQRLYRLDPTGGVVEVYGLRGGITPLGRLALPAGFRGERVTLDVDLGQLTVTGPEGTLALDPVALRVLASPGALATGKGSDSGATN